MNQSTSSSSAIDEILPELHKLWLESHGDHSVCVAVLDGPVDLTHPCFSGSRITSIPTLAFAGSETGTALAHGTHIASVIFGQHQGPIKGISPECRGLIIPIFGEFSDGEPVPCSQLDLARAINLAVQSGADVINISGGQHSSTGSAHPILADAIRKCIESGVLLVAAAGNQGCDCLHIPAALPAVLPVGAMGRDGGPLSFSNWGEAYRSRGILAPGVDIPGALTGGRTSHATGTSYATPIVSGLVALLMSAYLKRHGKKPSALQVRDAILAAALGCEEQPTEDCRRLLAGRLNVSRTMSILLNKGAGTMTEPEPNGDAFHPQMQAEPSRNDSSRESTFVAPIPFRIPDGLNPSGPGKSCSCGCDGGSSPQTMQLVYALGQLGFDFGTEARRDSFAQSMGPIIDERGRLIAAHGNPQDTRQLLAYLNENPWDAAALTWTLSIDATPVYAILPAGSFASATHDRLREFLQDMTEGVERVSVPGIVAGSIRLANGQIVPAIVPELRGMYSWTTDALVKSLMPAHPENLDETAEARLAVQAAEVAEGVRNFLERIYYELRNLGQTPQDRAINFSATNAFNIETVFENAHKQKLDLDTIEVERSPICRPESDCWDVKLMFFFPEKEAQAARRAYRFTVDVSDVVPVTVGAMRSWMIR
jgi:hypothetical protein